MIAMMILQDGPRLASFFTGTAARRFSQFTQQYESRAISSLSGLSTRTNQGFDRLWRQTSITQLLQGALITVLVLLLVW